jgi:hypothetical protein
MDLKSITRTLALLSMGTGLGLTGCASKKDAQEVTTPPADGAKAEGGCGAKADGEAGCGGAKADGEAGCGGAKADGEAGCGGAKADGEAGCGGAKTDASGAEAPTAEPEPTSAVVETAPETAPAAKPAKKKTASKKTSKPKGEMACGEGTCA